MYSGDETIKKKPAMENHAGYTVTQENKNVDLLLLIDPGSGS